MHIQVQVDKKRLERIESQKTMPELRQSVWNVNIPTHIVEVILT